MSAGVVYDVIHATADTSKTKISDDVTTLNRTHIPTNLTAAVQDIIVAVNPNTNTIYVTNTTSDSVSVIDGKTNKSQIIDVNSCPTDITVNSVINITYVANNCYNTISVIDKDGGTRDLRVPILGESAKSIAVNSEEKTVSSSVYPLGDQLFDSKWVLKKDQEILFSDIIFKFVDFS